MGIDPSSGRAKKEKLVFTIFGKTWLRSGTLFGKAKLAIIGGSFVLFFLLGLHPYPTYILHFLSIVLWC
jgi:hypothetical protein